MKYCSLRCYWITVVIIVISYLKTGFLVSGVQTLKITVAILTEDPERYLTEESLSRRIYEETIRNSTAGENSLEPVFVPVYSKNGYKFNLGFRTNPLEITETQSVYGSFLRTVPSWSIQADVWIDLLITMGYDQIILIYTKDSESALFIDRFKTKAEQNKIDIQMIFTLKPDMIDAPDLSEVEEVTSNIFLMHASSPNDCDLIFQAAIKQNLTMKGKAWILSEQAMQSPNIPEGVIGVRLDQTSSESLSDAFRVLSSIASSFVSHLNSIGIEPSSRVNCSDLTKNNRIKLALEELYLNLTNVNEELQWRDSMLSFNRDGDRLGSKYEIVNLQSKNELDAPYIATVGQRIMKNKKMILKLMKSEILWPGGTTVMPLVFSLPEKLMEKILILLWYPRADIAVAALSIDPDREKVIDFSKPWLYHGITIMEKKKPILNPMESFMQPFKLSLWTCLFASVVIIGISLFTLDKLSPFSRFYELPILPGEEKDPLHDSGTLDEETPLSFSGSMWFVWGVLLDSGIGEKTPRSFSARMLGMVWCGFSTIMVASYTANLAAFLVLDQPTSSLRGKSDTRFRNPSANFTFATVEGSATYMYFKRHVELSTMYRKMQGKNVESSADGIAAVKNGSLDAFIWDSTRLEFEAERDCTLVTSGEVFGSTAYGVGLQKNSPWTRLVTLAVLELLEAGKMDTLEGEWISSSKDCDAESSGDSSPGVRLGLTNMRDMFFLLAGGVGFGCILISFEILYKRHQLKRMHQRKLALGYGKLWRHIAAERRLKRNMDMKYPCKPLPVCNESSLDFSTARIHSF